MSGLIARHFDAAWPVAAGVIAIAVLFALADYLEQHDHLSDVGQTTTVAALLLYALGAYLMLGDMTIGVVIGAGLSGILGGLVSSTATTVTYARRTTEDPPRLPRMPGSATGRQRARANESEQGDSRRTWSRFASGSPSPGIGRSVREYLGWPGDFEVDDDVVPL